MRENEKGIRFSLFTEDLIDGLEGFFAEIEENSKNYAFIAIAERRCLNLAWSYLTDTQRVCSFSGLLLQYKAIAGAYRSGSPRHFPRILLVDDALFHGRGIARIISHLEELLFDELQPSRIEELFEMRRELTRAIDISVYAMNRFPTLLSERYLEKTTCREKLYSNDLRDVSLQLTDRLIRRGVANTCFVPSVRCQPLSDAMVKEAGNAGIAGDWRLLQWEYDGETMILACRLGGTGNVNRISTIRLFPERGERKLPWITSYTLLGDFGSEALDDLCEKAADILDVDGGEALRDILRRRENLLQHSRGQLLCYLVSAVDLIGFMECMGQADIGKAACENDSDKIAVNFGGGELGDALNLIFENRAVRERVATELIPALERVAGPILAVAPECCAYQRPVIPEAEREDARIFNDIVLDIFYRVGICSEENAYEKRDKPYLFHPETHQDYQEYRANGNRETTLGRSFSEADGPGADDEDYGCDGVIPLDVFGKLAVREILRRGYDVPNHVFQLMAAYVMLMDIGIMGNTVQISSKHGGFMLLDKSGELATHYFPRQMAAFIPALALIEDRYYRIGLTKMKALVSFYDAMWCRMAEDGEELIRKEVFDAADKKKWDEMAESLPEPEKMERYTKMLYKAGQSFGGWDFVNLCLPEYCFMEKCQERLFDAALKFLLLSD